MASSTTGVKRTRDALAALGSPHAPTKRLRAPCDPPSELAVALDGGTDGDYGRRAATLRALCISDAQAAALLQGLGRDAAVLRGIVDLNACARDVLAVVTDFAARGVCMTTLNVRVHSFSLGVLEAVLGRFVSFYAGEGWLCDVVRFVARVLFVGEERISICVLAGGGVRDVLIVEWCRSYNIAAHRPPPQVVVVRSESGRAFLVPFVQ